MSLSNFYSSGDMPSQPFIQELDGCYVSVTDSIKVIVRPVYLEGQSTPSEDRYVWAYHVRIENNSDNIIQLRSRTWYIIGTNGIMQEVRGSGVVGELPVLNPSDTFEYTSGTSLQTPSGIMFGSYRMIDMDGKFLDVQIPAFSLDSPYQPVTLN